MSIRKIPSLVAFPITAQQNQIYFQVPKEMGDIDMASSYQELELVLKDSNTNLITDLHNIVLGHDGLLYNGSSLFRQSKLYGSESHKRLYDMNYINILSNNLEYWTKGKNSVKADSLYSGQGATSYDNNIYSVFNNSYQDISGGGVIRVPLSTLFHGSLGSSDMLPQSEDLEFRYLMEPSYRCFMRAVDSELYAVSDTVTDVSGGDVLATVTVIDLLSQINNIIAGSVTITSTINAQPSTLVKTASNPTNLGNDAAFANVNANAVILPASALGTVAQFAQNRYVSITFTPTGGVETTVYRKITLVTADIGQTIGSITIDSTLSTTANCTGITVNKCPSITINTALDAANAATGVQVSQLTVSGGITCDPLVAAGTTLTLDDQTKTSPQLDLYPNTAVKVHYVDVNGVRQVQLNTVSTLTVNNNLITAVVLVTQVPIATSIELEPLYTNLDDYNWSLQNSHIVLYRRPSPTVHQEALLISDYESKNVQCLSGLSKFMYNFKFDANTYNIYVMTPTNTNLYSQAQGFQSYLMSVNEKPLTSIYIDVSSVVHTDNVVRVLSNSQYNQPKNLSNTRDDEITQVQYPLMFPAKVFQSVMKGSLNVQDFKEMDNDVRVELVAASTTPATMIYAFGERFNRV
jgi:hypothetical protein